MPAYNQENEERFIEQLRLIMVRSPRVTVRGATEAMARRGYPLDKSYINRLMRKIKGERAKRVTLQTLEKEVAKHEDLVETLANECWRIILDRGKTDEDGKIISLGSSASDKLRAIKTLVDAHKQLLDIKFDAGVFERQLGKLKSDTALSSEDRELIDKALAYATERSRTSED